MSMNFPIDYFFRGVSYQDLHKIATVLERFCARAPEAATLDQITNDIHLAKREVKEICVILEKMEIISSGKYTDESADEATNHWLLSGDPGTITLEDVWKAAACYQEPQNIPAAIEQNSTDDIDVMISQALLAINQSISTHLRKFQLDTVKIAQFGFWSMQ